MQNGRTGIKKQGGIFTVLRSQKLMRKQPTRLCWKKQKLAMPMRCMTWEKSMHRESERRQVENRQKNGMENH